MKTPQPAKGNIRRASHPQTADPSRRPLQIQRVPIIRDITGLVDAIIDDRSNITPAALVNAYNDFMLNRRDDLERLPHLGAMRTQFMNAANNQQFSQRAQNRFIAAGRRVNELINDIPI